MRVRSVRFRLLDSLRAVGLVLLAGATLLCPACGQGNRLKPYTVRGQVFFEGKPAAHALVVFHPLYDTGGEPLRPLGYNGPDGTFTLTTYAGNDGAPTGEYAVTVEWRQKPPPGQEGVVAGRSLLPTRYSRPDQSNLKVQIAACTNELPPLHLTR